MGHQEMEVLMEQDNLLTTVGSNNKRFDGFDFVSSNLEAEQGFIPSFSPINQGNFQDKWQFSQLTELKPAIHYSVAVRESTPVINSNGVMHSNDLPNQIPLVNSLIPVPCTQIVDSSMSIEQVVKIGEALEDPTADIGQFNLYLKRNDTEAEPNTMTQEDMEDIFSIIEHDQTAISSCTNTNQDIKPLVNYSDAVKESKPYKNNSGSLCQTIHPNQVSAVNTPCVQVTWQNTMKTKQVKPGPIRTRVGRCPRDELPLYLQPEPENKQEKRRWRRAITAHEHRENKKTELNDTSKMSKDLLKVIDELNNQLKTVKVERDAYKNTLIGLNGKNHYMNII
ncbi:unnamed protein product [Meganyctiphanes norvegica]|uniref:BZIP domain-containing protein n=1 Tax=Meganyctiphanes norvegica TaxID=48144 RepID=A0AAV2PY38_MEGNR